MNKIFSLVIFVSITQNVFAFQSSQKMRYVDQKSMSIKLKDFENPRIKTHRERLQLVINTNKPKLVVD